MSSCWAGVPKFLDAVLGLMQLSFTSPKSSSWRGAVFEEQKKTLLVNDVFCILGTALAT
jgi:hypothetical protein